LLEGYFFVHNFSNRENITFSLLKAVTHVKYWWDTFYEQNEIEEHSLFTVALTWESFRDAIKEQYYTVGSYDDLYTVNVYAIIIVLCISIDESIIRTKSLRNTHSQETQHLSWETL
jgi:hypothetical protein